MDKKRFTKWQESSRKDVERGYGVLKKKFLILNCICLHDLEDVIFVAETCIILHNMMVEERMKSGFVESDKFYEDERVLMNGDEDRIQSNEDNYLIQDRNGNEFPWSRNSHVTTSDNRNQDVDGEVCASWDFA